MKLCLPTKLFGRLYRAPRQVCKARLKAMWCSDLPLPPPSYDVDSALSFAIPPRMWHNDVEGDCVIAARANQQTRFLAAELGKLVVITDEEVQSEYLNETDGQDTGLVPEDSLALWQSDGWSAAAGTHWIAAWGRVDATDVLDVQRCIWLLQGMQLSLELPNTWSTALVAGEPWDVPADPASPDAQLGSWGGHQVYVKGYTPQGVVCLTWGKEQLITWKGLAWAGNTANQGEAQGVVRQNEAMLVPVDGLDVSKLLRELQEIDM